MKTETSMMLQELGMPYFLEECIRQEGLPEMATLPFEERVRMCLESECREREVKTANRYFAKASLRYKTATMENINYSKDRGLSQAVMAECATFSWARKGGAVLLIGPTGVGKTYVACALGHEACRKGLSVRFYRSTLLLTALAGARGSKLYATKLRALVRPDILIIDDFGLQVFDNYLCIDFLNVVEQRQEEGKGIILCTQYPVDSWPTFFEHQSAGDSIMDRLVHQVRINLGGPSLRGGAVG